MDINFIHTKIELHLIQFNTNHSPHYNTTRAFIDGYLLGLCDQGIIDQKTCDELYHEYEHWNPIIDFMN